MSYDFIKYEPSDGIARVTLNRPEKLNALSLQLRAELIDCLHKADDDPDIRVITLRGAGRAFCAGYDVTPPQTDEERETRSATRDNIRSDMHGLQKTARMMTSIFDLSKPVIAGIHGHVIAGGTDLALHCDLIIAADDANIGFPPVRAMGTPPTHMCTNMVGPQLAKWFMLTGETVTGKQAADMGLVLKSVPAADSDDALKAIFDRKESIRSGGMDSVFDGWLSSVYTPEFVLARPEIIEWHRNIMTSNNVEKYIHVVGAPGKSGEFALNQITAPTLIIVGAGDEYTGPDQALEIKDALDNAETSINIFPTRHGSPFERSVEYNQLILSFFNALESSSF